jgi:hypothetical protein
MPKEYIIYCDESESKGRHFSNFYGGALATSDDIDHVRSTLEAKKTALRLHGEVKWTKFAVNYANKYRDLVDCFFDLIAANNVKLRIMFTQNTVVTKGLTSEHRKNQYAILYYYFIRHAFGLTYSPTIPGGVKVRVYADQMPLSSKQVEVFKSYVARLSDRSEFRALKIRIPREDITEVISHDHVVLQCLDIVLGAMNFRLNDKHLDKPPGAKRRSPKTRAREKLYKHINKRIRKIYPYFNIGITTGHGGNRSSRWHHPYRHWRFASRDSVIFPGSKKKKGSP